MVGPTGLNDEKPDLNQSLPVTLWGAGKGDAANENPLVAHSASGSGTTPVSTAMRSSSGLASQVAW
jgi:hypothetical protein